MKFPGMLHADPWGCGCFELRVKAGFWRISGTILANWNRAWWAWSIIDTARGGRQRPSLLQRCDLCILPAEPLHEMAAFYLRVVFFVLFILYLRSSRRHLTFFRHRIWSLVVLARVSQNTIQVASPWESGFSRQYSHCQNSLSLHNHKLSGLC